MVKSRKLIKRGLVHSVYSELENSSQVFNLDPRVMYLLLLAHQYLVTNTYQRFSERELSFLLVKEKKQ